MIRSVLDRARCSNEKMSFQTSTWDGRSVENLGHDAVLAGRGAVETVAEALSIIVGEAFLITIGIANIIHSYEFVCTYGALFFAALYG